MNIEDYFQENLTFIMNESDQQTILEKMSEHLEREGYVKDTFKSAILDRERIYPTGLLVNDYGVAIPHTDSHHVKKASISVAILKDPVTFYEMGDAEEKVEVQLIFMLGVLNPSEQVNILQSIIGLIQDQEMVNKITGSKSKQEIITLLKEFVK